MQCACKSGLSYEACCEPFHKGIAHAPSALALMRSRFSAFARADAEYIMRTQVAKLNEAVDKKAFETELKKELWVDLSILSYKEDRVQFIAYLLEGAKLFAIKESSLFEKDKGRWYYKEALEQDISSESIGRNALCPCGSGKKFKRCKHQKEDI